MPTTERPAGLSRRALGLGLAALGAFAAFGGRAEAAATDRAEALVATLAQELTQLVNSGRGESQMYAAFEGILARYADMPAVAASVLGPPWRGASQAQRRQFVAAFQHYLARRYGKQFREYRSARIDVTGARDAGRAGVLVNTRVVRPGPGDHRRRLADQRAQRRGEGGEPHHRGGLDARQRARRGRRHARGAARQRRRADPGAVRADLIPLPASAPDGGPERDTSAACARVKLSSSHCFRLIS